MNMIETVGECTNRVCDNDVETHTGCGIWLEAAAPSGPFVVDNAVRLD